MRQLIPTRPTALVLAVAVVAAAVAVTLAVPASAQPSVTRIESGPTAVDQAVAWSQASFADGAAPTVIISRDDDYADALGAGALQGALQAPLLLTATGSLSPATAAEIQRLGATNAVILGGELAVSEATVGELEASGLTAERIAGTSRLETATAIIERFFPNATEIVLARAFGDTDPTQAFADSLTIAPYAAAANTPVLLTQSEVLSSPTAALLRELPVQRVLIVGGPDAIVPAVAEQAAEAIDDGDAATDEVVDRVSGSNRFDTAAQLNAQLGLSSGSDAARIILADGQHSDAWASAFPAGVQAGNGAAVVLSNGDDVPAETLAFISGAGVPLLCGPSVMPAACDTAAASIAGS